MRKLKIPEWDDHSVREVVQDRKGPLFVASPYQTNLDDVATRTCRAAPADLARLGLAIAGVLRGDDTAVPDLADDQQSLAREIAEVVRSAERPLVVSGTSNVSEEIIRAAAAVAWELCHPGRPAQLSYTVAESNSYCATLTSALLDE